MNSRRDLVRTANEARERRDYPRAAYLYGQSLTLQPEDSGILIQYGHMLKESGFFDKAAESYFRASRLRDKDADLALQIGHLAKIRGKFDEAIHHYQEAIRLGYPDRDWIEKELAAISIPRFASTSTLTVPEKIPGKVGLYLSSDLGDLSAFDVRALRGVIGGANYSYAFAQRGFLEALSDLEIDYTVLPNPELIANVRTLSDAPVNIHIGFYPPERIRLLKGGYNILAMAWEFERFQLETELTSHHGFERPDKMLALVDEIWSPSEFGSAALRSTSTTPVYTVPSPIAGQPRTKPRRHRPSYRDVERGAVTLGRTTWLPLAIVPRIQGSMRDAAWSRRSTLDAALFNGNDVGEPTVFCMVFNVHDYRKNVRPVLDAFVRFAKERPNAHLLLKINMLSEEAFVLNDRLFQHQLSYGNEMFPPLVSDRVWMTSDTFSRDEMNALYDMSSFYLCSAHAEGQNLPLLEAMSRGTVPISVTHTAMADYITEANSITLNTDLRPMDARLIQRYGMPGARTYYLAASEVLHKLRLAAALQDTGYADLSQNCLKTIREQFGVSAFTRQLAEAVNRASARAAAP